MIYRVFCHSTLVPSYLATAHHLPSLNCSTVPVTDLKSDECSQVIRKTWISRSAVALVPFTLRDITFLNWIIPDNLDRFVPSSTARREV